MLFRQYMVTAGAPAILATSCSVLMVGVNFIILLVLWGWLLQFSKKYLQSQVELQNQNWCHEHDGMTGLQISALFSIVLCLRIWGSRKELSSCGLQKSSLWSVETSAWQTWPNLDAQHNTSSGSFWETLYFPAVLVACNFRSYSWPRIMVELVTVLAAGLHKSW